MNRETERQSGQIALYVLIFSAVSVVILSGFVLWADSVMRGVFRDSDSAQAFMTAEAGIEYYRWHLAHERTDYQDGTAHDGPYTHPFKDKDGNLIGSFSLDITKPLPGSTVVTIDSTGTLASNSSAIRTIEATMAISSFVRFAAISGDFVRFGEGTDIYGPIHSNLGVRVDGVAHNLVTSSVADYNDPDHSGNKEFGVHTHAAPVDPLPPAAVPLRQDVFMAGREFPVAPVDFAGITQNLAVLKASASKDGYYWGASGKKNYGYHVVLKTNDTFDLYTVTAVMRAPNGCIDVQGQQDWGTWTIESQSKIGTYNIPPNGVAFFEDNVWVDGSIDTARITIAAGIFPENSAKYAHITINHSLTYTNYDGRDIIGLIAQGNISAGLNSDDVLRIDGALLAQHGRVGRYYYRPESIGQTRCKPYDVRQQLTLYGMFASQERYGFAYSDGTGYQRRIIIFDANLKYFPPPDFPLSSNYYSPIFWSEK